MLRQDEYLGGGDGIKPPFDPSPDGREERRCSKDLVDKMSADDLRLAIGFFEVSQIFGRAFRDNEQSQVYWHPAYGSSGSRTASAQLWKCPQCCWTDRPVSLGLVGQGLQNIEA